MSYKIRNKEKNKLVVEIKINPEKWEECLQKCYEEEKGKFSVQGFRKGKVPRKVIEKQYGEGVFFDHAIDIGFADEYNEFLDKNLDIEPITQPDVKIEKFEKDGIVLSASVEIVPEVKLGTYTGITIEKGKEKVKKADVEKELKLIAERQARFVESSEAAKMGDFATIDFAGSVDGKIFEGGTAQNYRLELGSKSFIDTFEQQIVGMKVGDSKDVNVTFPENYQEKTLAGKPALFKVILNKLETKELPEINDEFAANVSEFENLEDYKNDIEKRLQIKLENEKEKMLENELIEKIVKESEVEIPEILVEKQVDMFVRDLEMRLGYQGVKVEDYLQYTGTTLDKFKEDRKEIATQTVKTRLVLEELVKKEKMGVTDIELDKVLSETADKYKKSLADFKKSLDNKTVAYYQNDILMKKLLEFLKNNNNII
ncbi:MAG: trigger factor [Clostridia bacterium]|nr:trigger factor [Clostridia bacterium]